jgi:uncharacterized protein DUF4105
LSRSCVRCCPRLFAVALVLLLVGRVVPAGAGSGDSEILVKPIFATSHSDDRGGFLEFRARSDDAFGHAYMVLGIVDHAGIPHTATFGFLTLQGAPSGLAALFGSVGEIAYSQSDVTQSPSLAYRIQFSPAKYRAIVQEIEAMEPSWAFYELLFSNCNTFMGAVAHLVGLKAPAFDALEPVEYVRELVALNTSDPAYGQGYYPALK